MTNSFGTNVDESVDDWLEEILSGTPRDLVSSTQQIFLEHGVVSRADIHHLRRRLRDFDFLTKELGLKAGPAARISSAVVSDCSFDPAAMLLRTVDEIAEGLQRCVEASFVPLYVTIVGSSSTSTYYSHHQSSRGLLSHFNLLRLIETVLDAVPTAFMSSSTTEEATNASGARITDILRSVVALASFHHLTSTAVCEKALTAIRALCKTSSQHTGTMTEYSPQSSYRRYNREIIRALGDAGLCEVVVSILRSCYLSSPEIAEQACMVIECIAIDDDLSSKLVTIGVSETLVAVLIEYGSTTTHTFIIREALSALLGLLFSDEKAEANVSRLRIAGVCEAVVAVLTGVHARINSTVAEKACTLVKLLAMDPSNRERLGAVGACKAIVPILKNIVRSGQGDAALTANICAAINNLSHGGAVNVSLFMEAEAVNVLVELLNGEIGKTSAAVSEKACYAIAALAIKSEYRLKLCEAGACEAVYTAMDLHCCGSRDPDPGGHGGSNSQLLDNDRMKGHFWAVEKLSAEPVNKERFKALRTQDFLLFIINDKVDVPDEARDRARKALVSLVRESDTTMGGVVGGVLSNNSSKAAAAGGGGGVGLLTTSSRCCPGLWFS